MSQHDHVRALIALVRREPHAESARRDAASFQAFEARLERRKLNTRRMRFALALALCSGLAALVSWRLSGPEVVPLGYEVIREAHVVPARVGTSRLSFSDGSSVALDDATQAHVLTTSARGADVVLTRGQIDADIVPRRDGDWWFEAGPYRVHVTGTAFALAWSPDDEVLRLTMHSGSVVVSGPLAGQGMRLHAGQRLIGSPREHRLHVEPVAQAAPAVSPASEADEEVDAAVDELPVEERVTGSARARRPAPLGDMNFESLLAQGAFEDVVRAARQLGVERVLRRAHAGDLSALADAARYESDPVLALRALQALRTRFPSTSAGQSAAYFLARVSRGPAAVRWYETYLREQPSGAYAAPALGALMVLQSERGQPGAALASARAYLRREPHGPYAAAARTIVTENAQTSE